MTVAEGVTLDIIQQQQQTTRIICPDCGPIRQKKHERTLAITVAPNETLYMCHHCGLAGRVDRDPFYSKYIGTEPAKAPIVQIPTQLNNGNNQIMDFFAARGTPFAEGDPVPKMIIGRKWYRKSGQELDSIGFVYPGSEGIEAIKWRPLQGKDFTQDGAARSFWGIDLVPDKPDTLVIVEGECDQVALTSIGVMAISCPNGAPIKAGSSKFTPDDDVKFSYVWNAREKLEAAKKVILAVDNDGPGEALAEELGRRIGRAKCWVIHYPTGCNDPTDAIKKKGKAEMLDVLDRAEPMPLHGVYSASDYTADLHDVYHKGHGKGESTGIAAVDELFTIAEGQLSVITGIPNSGKSEFVDQIMVNLALHSGWKFAVASFENEPHLHMAKMAEKIVGKPFYEGVTPRMSRDDLGDATDFINNHFAFLDSKDGAVATIESIIDRTKQAVMRLGVRGLVIDPYNYIETSGDKEHKTISDMLTKVVMFAKAHGIHVFFVAHPKGMIPLQDGTFPVPTGMHISGGPTWFAKADVGITVHRGKKGVEVHCWKCRHKWVGSQGMAYVDYDVPTGRYRDYPKGYNPDTTPTIPIAARVGAPRHYLDDIDEATLEYK